MSIVSAGILVVLVSVAAIVVAGEDSGHRLHEAHVHGVGALNLAREGADLYLELSTPAANLVGFEHAPGNAQQQAQLQQVRAWLSEPARLIVLPEDARCHLAAAEVEMPSAGNVGAPSAHLDPDDTATHADIHAEYRFVCDRPSALDGLDVLLFELFPALHRLQVQYIVPGGQAAAVLTPREHRLNF